MATKVVIFEDNDQLREMLFQMINISEGLSCTGAYANAMDLDYKIRRSQPDMVLMDIDMPGMSGIEFFESILKSHPLPIRILITGYTDINAVIDAINRGQVYKYLTKPWSENDIKIFVDKAYEVYMLRKQNTELTDKLDDANDKLEFLARQNLLS